MSSCPAGEVKGAVLGKTIVIKAIALAVQNNCLGLPDFIRAMAAQGCDSVLFDLSDCTGIDSTFIGVLADAAKCVPRSGEKNVVVLDPEKRFESQLKKVGLANLLTIRTEVEKAPEVQFQPIDQMHLPADERERLTRIMELHKELVGLNEHNETQFGEFVKAMELELGDHQ